MREIWRLLENGERTRNKDQQRFRQAATDNFFWKEVGCGFEVEENDIIRRRETIEDEPKWEEVKNRTATTWSMFPKLCRYEDGTFHFLPTAQIQSHHTTHYFKLPPLPQAGVDFETFWQRNKQRMLDTTREQAKLIYEEARK